MPGAPRRPITDVPGQLAAQYVQPQLNVPVCTAEIGDHVDQPLGDEHADVTVEDPPSDLKSRDEVAFTPSLGPVVEAQIADRGGGVGSFACRERPPLNGAP